MAQSTISALAVAASNRQPPKNGGRKGGSLLCDQIEQHIISSNWPVGQNLGSEAQLLDRYGVSRAVLREAIRLLEHHGVAEMRRGPGGGLFVTRPDPDAVVHAMALFLEFTRVSPQQLMEMRVAVELVAAQLAAERVDEEQITALRAFLNGELENLATDVYTHGHDFHILLARITGNPVIELFVRCLVQLTARQAKPTTSMNRAARLVHSRHVPIGEAVIAGDAALARHRMLRELEAMVAYLRESDAQDVGALT